MLNELALFAGGGGGILGSILLGWCTVCAVEIDPYCREVLLSRQRDGCLEPFPIWDDIKTFEGRLWRGHVDIVTGGFPYCTERGFKKSTLIARLIRDYLDSEQYQSQRLLPLEPETRRGS